MIVDEFKVNSSTRFSLLADQERNRTKLFATECNADGGRACCAFGFFDIQSLHLENLVHCGHLLSDNGNPGKMDKTLPLNA